MDFLRFRVLDFDGFSDILAQTEKLKFDGVEYKMERKHIPIGLNRVWDFKLEPLGDFPE